MGESRATGPGCARARRCRRQTGGIARWGLSCAFTLLLASIFVLVPRGAAWAAATLSVSPASAASGASLTVTGSGWHPNDLVDVYWSATEQNGATSASPDVAIGSVRADASGNISATITAAVPNQAVMQVSGGLNSTPFCPTSVTGEAVQGYSDTSYSFGSVAQSVYFSPWLIAAPPPSTPGASLQFDNGDATYLISSTGQVVVAGCYFTPGSGFTLSFPGQSPITGTVAADGSVEATVDITSITGYTSGNATLSDGSLSASFPVVVYSPTIQATPASVAAGSSLTVSGAGLAPNAPLTIEGYSGATLLGNAPTGVTTQADGSFSFTWNVPANQASGTYSILVSVPAGASASTQVDVSGTSGGGGTTCPAGPYHLSFSQEPPATTSDASPFQVQVAVLGAGNAIDTCSSDTIALSLSGGSGVLTGVTQVAAQNGTADFSLSLSGASGSGYALAAADATDATVTSATSSSIAVANDHLVFTQQPPADLAWNGPAFTVTVAVYTPSGTLDTANIDRIALGLNSPAGAPATLGGALPERIVGGKASFTVTLAGGNGSGYSLQATDASNTLVGSAASTGMAFPEARISFGVQPPALAVLGGTVTATVTAVVYDQSGAVMPGQQMAVSLLEAAGATDPVVCSGTTSQASCSLAASATPSSLSIGVNGTWEAPGSGYVLQVSAANGYAVKSQPFTLLAASPLIMSGKDPWSAGDTYGVWGVQQPSYQSPASDAGFPLPYKFAGVRMSLPYVAGTHAYLAGDNPNAQICVDGSWEFDISGGAGSSVATSVYGSGCHAPVDLATLGLPTGTYGAQLLVTATSSSTDYGTGDIILYSTAACDCWSMPDLATDYHAIGLALGSSSLVVGTAGQVPVNVTLAPLPVAGVHAEATWDPTALDLAIGAPAGGSIGYGDRVPGHWGFMAFTSAVSSGTGGYPILDLSVTCLQPGSWPVAMSGSWWGGDDVVQPFSFSGTITCTAPAAGQGTVSPGPQVNPADGSLSVAVTGANLSSATQAVFVDAAGTPVAISSSVTVAAKGTSLTAHFTSVPGGVHTLRVEDRSGQVLATLAGMDVPPALPVFTVREGDALPQVPGFHETHFWRVRNVGEVDGVAVLLFVFPDFVTPEPTLDLAALPAGSQLLEHDQSLDAASGSWAEIVSVPVRAGRSVDVPWTITLDPSAVFGASAPLSAGDNLPVVVTQLGALTTAQAQTLQLLSGPASGFGTQLGQDSNGDLVQALGGVAGLQGDAASSYRAYLEATAPDLAEQLYQGGLIGAVQTLEDDIKAGLATLPQSAGGTNP